MEFTVPAVHVHLPSPMIERLRRASAASGLSVSDIVRRCIDAALDAQAKTDKAKAGTQAESAPGYDFTGIPPGGRKFFRGDAAEQDRVRAAAVVYRIAQARRDDVIVFHYTHRPEGVWIVRDELG